ncbi:YbaB/EbfC family nucleoid-associated protein [Rhodococcus tibetensis]|uniref:YbaB/EbfC family nucleoid-associated protein n=1 Tax=Rhodococcus tibetensis TaxID=2965064 RepID=A0ABT1QDR4_9NOCA|nr:YbaB/EbfC family nucleoid-associated protein [Rhodococcus sp. FXJ9.536]MCQ4120424.1 YbaB/EbfC family nucleoid-associated protein [Rhodococcus sp. FXJ9.536]
MVDPAARDELRARNEAFRHQLDSMLDTLRRQADSLVRARAEVASATGSGTSSDGLVRIGVDAAGIVTAVDLSADTFRRTSPERLGSSIAEAARGAVADVRLRTADALAPVLEARRDLPDLSELVPDAPRLGDLQPCSAEEPGWDVSVLRRADR